MIERWVDDKVIHREAEEGHKTYNEMMRIFIFSKGKVYFSIAIINLSKSCQSFRFEVFSQLCVEVGGRALFISCILRQMHPDTGFQQQLILFLVPVKFEKKDGAFGVLFNIVDV